MATRLGQPSQLRRDMEAARRRTAASWFNAVDNVRAAVSWTRVMEALEQGALDQVAGLLITRAVLTGVIEQTRASYLSGTQTIERAIPASARDPRGGRLLFRFDVTDPRAERWLTEHSSRFITQVTTEQRQAVRAIVSRGVAVGQNPKTTALDLVGRVSRETGRRTGGVIGLNGPQARLVADMRTALTSEHGVGVLRVDIGPDGRAKPVKRFWISNDGKLKSSYTRRDKRLDGMVRKAITQNKPLTAVQVNRIVDRYSDRLLQLRGEAIARTESIQGFAEGRHAAFDQLRERTNLQDEDIIRRWDATMDRVTRNDHIDMDGQEREPEEPFTAPDGSLLMHPGDTSLGADASQLINCRCLEVLEVDFIAAEARNN